MFDDMEDVFRAESVSTSRPVDLHTGLV
jgi:hypothetical protein